MKRRLSALLSAVLALAAVALLLAHMPMQGGASVYATTGAKRTAPRVSRAAVGGIDPNTATAEELTALYGVGEKLAAEIVAERERNGRFDYLEDLITVKGIGRKKLEGFLGQLAPIR